MFDLAAKYWLPVNLIGQDSSRRIHVDGNGVVIKRLKIYDHVQSGHLAKGMAGDYSQESSTDPLAGILDNLNAGVAGLFGVLKFVELKNLTIDNPIVPEHFVDSDANFYKATTNEYLNASQDIAYFKAQDDTQKAIELYGSLAGYSTFSDISGVTVKTARSSNMPRAMPLTSSCGSKLVHRLRLAE
ncbi:MAG: hypothetical protein LBP35_01045 [Candidatus Ancillula trichonymphae]|nr:hypothetical protein [Candidatus Ancillula trichonymphae]